MRVFVAGIGILLILLMVTGCSSSRGALDTSPEGFRCYYDGRIQQLGNPSVYVDFVQFFVDEKPRLDMYLEVPHANLHFATDAQEKLETEYIINITVNDRDNNIVDRKELRNKVSTTRQQISRYGASDRTMYSFTLEPGEYRFIINMLDRAAGNRSELREVVEVVGFDPDPIAFSDILLIRSIRREGDRRVINPMLSNRVLAVTEPFSVFTEVYSNGDHREVTFEYGIVQNYYNNDFLIDNPFSYRVQRPYHRTGIRIEEQDTVFVSDTTLTLTGGSTQLFLPFEMTIDRGTYEVFVRPVLPPEAAGGDEIIAREEFITHALDFPHMTDVDQQIEALTYIASTREMNHIKSGETLEERRRRLNEYWQEVGAWKMSDYYERVRLANELFTTNVEGWKTPMGMVFIILGEPHMFDCRIGIERTETWTYYLQSGGIEFVFIRERTAEPDYRLAYYWVSSIRGGYSAWLSALNAWR
jgi:GWxTD domain-containing protein